MESGGANIGCRYRAQSAYLGAFAFLARRLHIALHNQYWGRA
jgi:hypothetical protein